MEAVLTPNPDGERVLDELYARAAAHYDTIAEPIPGREPHYRD